MINILTDILQKILYNDKVKVINRLSINAPYEQFYKKEFEKPLTDREEIIAGVLSLVHAPVTISYGVLLAFVGLILAPLPNLLLEMNVKDSSLSFNRKNRQLESISIISEDHMEPHTWHPNEVRERRIKKLKLVPKDKTLFTLWESKTVDHTNIDRNKVGGVGLIRNGIGLMVEGAFQPLVGLGSAAFFSGKKAVDYIHRHYNHFKSQKLT